MLTAFFVARCSLDRVCRLPLYIFMYYFGTPAVFGLHSCYKGLSRARCTVRRLFASRHPGGAGELLLQLSFLRLYNNCSLLKNQTVPKERHTPHGGSAQKHDSEFRTPPVLTQESIRVVTTAGRGTNRGTRRQTRLRGGVPSVPMRPSSEKCGGEEGETEGRSPMIDLTFLSSLWSVLKGLTLIKHPSCV